MITIIELIMTIANDNIDPQDPFLNGMMKGTFGNCSRWLSFSDVLVFDLITTVTPLSPEILFFLD